MIKKAKSPLTMIFADDEIHALTLFKQTLKEEIKSGLIDLLTFTNGEDCLNHLEADEVNLKVIFSDISMPEIDGFTLLERVKAMYPHVDMFVISGHDLDDYKMKADSIGAKGFLTKPINFKAIKAIIHDYIEK